MHRNFGYLATRSSGSLPSAYEPHGQFAPTSSAPANAEPPTPRSIDDNAKTLRKNIDDSTQPGRHKGRFAVFTSCFSPSPAKTQRQLLKKHGFVLKSGTVDFDEQQEQQLRKALATLLEDGGTRDDPESNIRMAFVLGDKGKIDAVLTLHELGLLDLDALGTDGDALVHAIVRTPLEPDHAGFRPQRSTTVSLANRFTLLKDAGADLDCFNKDWQRPVEIALSSGAPAMRETVGALIGAGINVQSLGNIDGLGYFENDRDKYNENLLHFAARYTRVEVIDLLLEQGLDINAASRRGSAISLAASKAQGAKEYYYTEKTDEEYRRAAVMVRALLEKGADVNGPPHGGNTPLENASFGGGVVVAKALLENGADVEGRHGLRYYTPLHSAALSGSVEMVSFLIANGANVHATTETEDRISTLHCAARSYNPAKISVLVENGANIHATDSKHQTVIHYWAEQPGKPDMLKILLENGANVNAVDDYYQTALHLAIKSVHEMINFRFMNAEEAYAKVAEAVKALLEHGANVNIQSRYDSVLDAAAKFGNADIARALFEKGVQLRKSDQKRPELHHAAERNKADVARVLLENGADPNAFYYSASNAKLTAMRVAKKHGAKHVVRVLRQFKRLQKRTTDVS